MAISSEDRNPNEIMREKQNKKPQIHYKIVLEIEAEAENPLEAAKEIQSWLDAANNKWVFYVQEEDSSKVFSVDLDEDDDDAVLEVDDYIPMIK